MTERQVVQIFYEMLKIDLGNNIQNPTIISNNWGVILDNQNNLQSYSVAFHHETDFRINKKSINTELQYFNIPLSVATARGQNIPGQDCIIFYKK